MRQLLTFNFYFRLFIYLSLGFILTTIIGTVSHEGGHYIAAKYYGFKPHLMYASVDYIRIDKQKVAVFDSLYKADKEKIESAQPSPEKEYFIQYRDALKKEIRYPTITEGIVITAAGPLQTVITGTIGLILLWIRRKKIKHYGMQFWDWLFVFMAFFWSREVFNCLGVLLYYTTQGSVSTRGDETKLAEVLQWPLLSIICAAGALGLLLLSWVTFKVIPKQQRFTFICSGIVGSALGFIVWIHYLGPVILP